MSFAKTEMEIIQWAESRGIIPNASSETQLLKCMSELGELADALISGDDVRMELGDVLTTLVIFAAGCDIDLTQCLEMAYDKISKRTGKRLPNGVFLKSA